MGIGRLVSYSVGSQEEPRSFQLQGSKVDKLVQGIDHEQYTVGIWGELIKKDQEQ